MPYIWRMYQEPSSTSFSSFPNPQPSIPSTMNTTNVVINRIGSSPRTALMREPVSPLCFLFPAQYQQFLDVSDALGFDADWILKPLQSMPSDQAQNKPKRVDVFSKEGKDKIREFTTKRGIIQQLVSSPLLVYGQPVSLQFFILVTSTEPLRAYVHSKGLVYLRASNQSDFQKVRKMFLLPITT